MCSGGTQEGSKGCKGGVPRSQGGCQGVQGLRGSSRHGGAEGSQNTEGSMWG